MRTQELFAFIKERRAIYERKAAGKPKPWTNDPILQRYKFCNVYRELDTETKWLSDNWRTPHAEDEYFWFAALVFRFVNWHETAEELGYPVPWNPARFVKVLERRKNAGLKVYSGAYMISTHGVKEPKHTYLAKSLTKIWKQREKIRYKEGETLAQFHSRLQGCFDVGSFLAGQVIADAKYVGEMSTAKDWWRFAASGPGSRRGLNIVCNMPMASPWKEEKWCGKLAELHTKIIMQVRKARMPPLHAQDLQNCLCEYSKYSKVKLGLGRPKSRYNGISNAEESQARRELL